MSKMDDLRSMREARHAQATARPAGTTASRPRVSPPAQRAASSEPALEEPGQDEAGQDDTVAEALCGHRAISGRTCTREKGHAARSHRYS